MQQTARLQIPYPDLTDIADNPLDLKNLAQALDGAVIYGQGPIASRPISTPGVPGKQGRFYMSLDENPNILYYDSGTSWISVGAIPPGSVGTLQLADRSVTEIKIALGAVGTPEVADAAVTTAKVGDGAITGVKLAPALKPSQGAGAATEAVRALGVGAGLALNINDLPSLNRIGLRADRPAPNAVNVGTRYYASDQNVEYISDGANWIRISPKQPGDITMTIMAAAAPGRILCQGQAWPSTTGPYADLYARWGGSSLPDFRGRMPVGLSPGGKAAVDTLLKNEGVAFNLRSPYHLHYTDGGNGASAPLGTLGGDNPSLGGGNRRSSGDVDNFNTPAFLVVNWEAQL